ADDVWVWPQAISSEKAHNGKSSYKVTPRSEGTWPNVVFGSATTGYHDLTKAESISVWVYFDSSVSESVSNLGIKVVNHNESGFEGERYEKKYTIPSKTWTKLTLNVADLQSSNVDLTKAYVKFSQLGDYVDRSVFYLDDFAVVYPKTEGDDALIEGYEKGERLAYVQYAQMVGNVGSGKGAPVTLRDAKNNALVEYNFKQGSVEKGMSLFDTYTYNYVGEENSTKTRSAIWKLYLNNDVSFIYEIVAKQRVFIDITNQVEGVDGATGTTTAWLNSSVLRMYVKSVDGKLTKLYEYSISDSKLFGFDENGKPVGLEVSGILLEAGETFYYELYKYYDGRNLTYPPYLNVYAANPVYHSHEFTKVVENEVPATCETAGSYEEVEKCSCGAEQNRTTIEVPAFGHGVQKGERLAYAKFVDMVWFVGNGQGQDVALKGADGTELVTYNFKHGSVENGMQKFDSYATNLLGTNTSSLSGQNKKAFSETWKIWTGYQDAFIYEITAKKTVYIDLKAQIKGVDGAEGDTVGWLSDSNSFIKVYVKDANGNLTLKLSYKLNNGVASGVDANGNPLGVEVLNVLLQAGETLYYEYSFIYDDHRNISNPPYLNVYAASGSEKVLEAVAPTCTSTGLTEGKACGKCDKVLVAQQEVPALGHTEAEAVKENEVPATCTVAGSYDLVVYCATCGAELSRTTVPVDALGHTEAEAVKENVVPATCTVAGSHDSVVYCATCGTELSRTNVTDDALGHDEVIDEAVAANCVTVGLTEGSHCSRCGEVFVAQQELGLGDHSYGEWEIVTPTEGPNDGLQKKTCEHCGDIVEEVIPHDEDWDVATMEDCQGSITTSSMAMFGLLTAVVAIVRKKRS
ncbi:MAG: hypothetical protein IKT32_05230, partial [Clostridia bacterium]|nr:hypothetical protein [Clostridia bacterium]